MALNLGTLYLHLGVKAAGFKAGMGQASEAVSSFVGRTKEGLLQAGAFGAALTAMGGAAAVFAADHSPRAKAAIDQLTGVTGGFAMEVANLALPTLEQMGERLRKVLGFVQALSPELKASAGQFLATAAGVLAAAGALGKMMEYGQKLGPLFSVLGKGLLSAFTGPGLAAAAAIGLLIVAAGLLYRAWKQNSEAISAAFGGAWDWIAEHFSGVLTVMGDGIRAFISMAFQNLRDLVSGAEKLLKALGIEIPAAFEFAQDLINWGEFLTTSEGLSELKKDAFRVGATIGGTIMDGIKGAGELVGDLARSLGLDDLVSKAQELWKNAPAGKLTMPAAPATAAKAAADKATDKGKVVQEVSGTTDAVNASLGRLVGGLGELGPAIQSASGAFATGGPFAAMLDAVISLLMGSEQFQQVIAICNAIFHALADVFGKLMSSLEGVFDAVAVVVEVVIGVIGPIFDAIAKGLEMLSGPLQAFAGLLEAITPALEWIAGFIGGVLSKVFQFLAWALEGLFHVIKGVITFILRIVQGIGYVWNGILSALQAVFRAIGGFEIAGAKPFGFLEDWADGLESAKMNTAGLDKQIKDLDALTYEEAKAKAKGRAEQMRQTEATRAQTKAVKAATEAFSYVPSGYKLALRRWQSMSSGVSDELMRAIRGSTGGIVARSSLGQVGPGDLPHLAEGGIARRATLAMIGEGGEAEAVLPLSKLGALLEAGGHGGGARGGDTYHVKIVSNDPERIWRELERVRDRKRFQRFGTLSEVGPTTP